MDKNLLVKVWKELLSLSPEELQRIYESEPVGFQGMADAVTAEIQEELSRWKLERAPGDH